jgi:hypothetical protein
MRVGQGLVALLPFMCFMGPREGMAQISPGELSAAHSTLEGMGNCTSCHSLGRTLTNDKCLDCHTELKSRMSSGRGFHVKLSNRKCDECHKEHHGRKFSLVQFDTKSFDHQVVGFVLDGKHRTLNCAVCHSAKYIRDKDILANPTLLSAHTFLGLSGKCNSCHTDPHRGQFSGDCSQCHGVDAWKPASRFSHDRAKFRLAGLHGQTPCGKCHPRDADESHVVIYTGLRFSQCSSCHTDPHRGQMKKPCEGCHSTAGWREGAAQHFDHSNTQFPLRGKHAAARCESCHGKEKRTPSKGTVRPFAVEHFGRCTDCHKDPHRREFASRPDKGACESCHSENGFVPSQFSHAAARFSLTGLHQKVLCRKCHVQFSDGNGGKGSLSFRVAKFLKCSDCHADYHNGQFLRRADRGDCETCHSVNGFLPPGFSLDDHARTRFPLAGAHAAVPCTACHLTKGVGSKKTREYTWSPEARCSTCHKDPHLDELSTAKYGGCETCHSVQAWQVVTFSHEKTRFILTGRHATAKCERCHQVATDAGRSGLRRYAGTPTKCTDCHTDDRSGLLKRSRNQ